MAVRRKRSLSAREPRSPSVFIVGAGRLGGAIASGLLRAGWSVATSTRRSRPRRGGVRNFSGTLPPAIAEAEVVLITVPDAQLPALVKTLAARGLLRAGQVVAHCAGALDLSCLEPARRCGAYVGSLHPLVAAAAGARFLEGRTATIVSDARAAPRLRRIARDLELHAVFPAHLDRARYHASASLAANGLVALASLAREELCAAGFRAGSARRAILDLLGSSLDGLALLDLPAALTGPIARGDAAIVEAHLRSLAGKEAKAAYVALARRAVALSRARGRAEPKALDRIERLLRRAGSP